MTRAIVEAITEREATSFPALTSVHTYVEALMGTANWREFYGQAFSMTEAEVDRAGGLWAEYQLVDDTHSAAFAGIPQALEALADLPHGIVSQNGRANILSILEANDIGHHFRSVIGYEEVDFKRQKPSPEGLLQCLEELTQFEPGYVFYVGDHATDTLCAAEARAVLKQRDTRVEVISVATFYGDDPRDTWPVAPDHVARHPADIVSVVRRYTDGVESPD